MRGTRNGKEDVEKNGTVTTLDITGRVPGQGCSAGMPLPSENLHRLRVSCARLRKPAHEILSLSCVLIAPPIDVTQYLNLARNIARWFYRRARGRGIDLDDLTGEACLVLVEASHRFDASLGTTFGDYAWIAIRNRLIYLLRRHRRHNSLVGADSRIVEPEARPMPDPDAALDVQTLLPGLSPREKDVVEKWFGLNRGEAWKVMRLAAHLKTSPDSVHMILERALATLRRRAQVLPAAD
jgi:RNA polymerase sigma factor (sigma-70 family)